MLLSSYPKFKTNNEHNDSLEIVNIAIEFHHPDKGLWGR